MSALNTIATGVIVAIAATGGAYIGTFGSQMFAGDDTAPPPPRTQMVALLPVSVPVYAAGQRLGYCVVNAGKNLPNNFSDEDFQIATSRVSDIFIQMLSTIAPDQDPAATCLAADMLAPEGVRVTNIEFMGLEAQ